MASEAGDCQMFPGRVRRSRSAATARRGFTLVEVMFALVAFCTATFVILALVANSLSNARRLQRPMVDAGVVASWLSQTNLVVGIHHINLGELLGDAYNNYTCDYDVERARTNKLFQVDFVVQNDRTEPGENPVVSKMSILLYSPNSPDTP
jgi:prepilin-type N-terminal cleavage/methylation domain-containing protein